MLVERKGNLKYSSTRNHIRRSLAVMVFFMILISIQQKFIPRLPTSIEPSITDIEMNTKSSHILPYRHDWINSEVPSFCEDLKSYPQPFDNGCKRTKEMSVCNSSRSQFFSQDGEDYYLYTRHFKKKSKPGVYVDIAANDAIQISNTYFFDRCLGWQGICAEANPKYFERLHRERSCHLIPTCISDIDGNKVKFGLRGASGGILNTYKGNLQQLEQGPIETFKCITLKTVLNRFNVKHIDYLSVDVEGHELLVLKSINWDITTVDVITIELSSRNRHGIMKFLTERGFISFPSGVKSDINPNPFLMNDPVFIHKRVKFGYPDITLTQDNEE